MWLEKVVVTRNVLKQLSNVDVAAIKDIISTLPLHVATDANVSLNDLKEQVRSVLTSAGFTGSGDGIIPPYGLFYPQRCVLVDVDVDLVICSELRWMFGRPGLLVARGEYRTICVPGVLVGEIGIGSEVEEYMLGSTGLDNTGSKKGSRAELEQFQYRTYAPNVGFKFASDGGIGSELSRTRKRS